MSPLDHGLLNLPLAKRGDIDAQIDRYKAGAARNQAAKRKEAALRLNEQRIEAKRIVAAMTPERVAELAAKCNTTSAEVRRIMKSNAHWMPNKVILSEASSIGRSGERGEEA